MRVGLMLIAEDVGNTVWRVAGPLPKPASLPTFDRPPKRTSN
jgi:hypothetical protein